MQSFAVHTVHVFLVIVGVHTKCKSPELSCVQGCQSLNCRSAERKYGIFLAYFTCTCIVINNSH